MCSMNYLFVALALNRLRAYGWNLPGPVRKVVMVVGEAGGGFVLIVWLG